MLVQMKARKERTKPKVQTVNASLNKSNCNDDDNKADAGPCQEAWPLMVSRLGLNTGSLSESLLVVLIGKEQNSSCAHI
jgi:hypothetical protein